MIRIITLVVFVMSTSISSTLFGQFGIKVGYAGTFFEAEQTRQIINEFNILNPRLESKLKPMYFTNGVNLGARYQLSRNTALNLDWVGTFDFKTAEGLTNKGVESTMQLNTGVHSIKAGMDFFFGPVGLGGSLDFQLMNMRLTVDDVVNKLINTHRFAYTLYGELNFLSNNSITGSIRPFIQLPLANFDVSPLATALDVSDLDTQDAFWSWGVTVIFINGGY